MKILIIGGVAGGATTATRLRRMNEEAEIIVIDRGDYVSFANCGLPYYIGDVIRKKEKLLLQTPKSFLERFNIDVRIKQEAIHIDRAKKEVKIRKINTGEEYVENYDKLVLSPGANPINPYRNMKINNIMTLRTVNDSVRIKEEIIGENIKNIAIIGGGYIGVEIAENLANYKDKNIIIIEKKSHLIASIDKDIACFVNKKLKENEINILLNNGVEEIEENKGKFNIKLERGNIEVDYIIIAIGVSPESKLAKEAGLEINEKGAIIVNKYLQTKDENIYALGDAIENTNSITGKKTYIALAGPANRQARIVADNICGKKEEYEGAIGSSILKVFDSNLGTVGLNEEICKTQKISYKKMIVSPYSHATYYPGANMVNIKAIYNEKGEILGAQIFGKEGVDKLTDILSIAIKLKINVRELEKLELCYAPPFSSAKSPINILANAIVNELDGLVKNIYIEDLENETEKYILDVRTKEEFEDGHISSAINIPLDELRQNLYKLDKSKEIIVHCRTGLRSYIACRILTQNGFNVKNLVGGYYLYSFMKGEEKYDE